MLTKDDLQQIRGVVKEEIQVVKQDLGTVKQEVQVVKQDLGTVKQQLNTVEMKVELVNKRVEQAQEETVDALSELIHESYNLHEKRIKKIEEQLQPPQTQ